MLGARLVSSEPPEPTVRGCDRGTEIRRGRSSGRSDAKVPVSAVSRRHFRIKIMDTRMVRSLFIPL